MKYKLHVRLFDQIKVPFPNFEDYVRTLRIPRRRFLSILRKHPSQIYDDRVKQEIIEAGVLIHVPSNKADDPEIRYVNSRVIGYESIQGQLTHCRKRHPLCQKNESMAMNSISISLIDCVQGRVVEGTTEDPYMTLSYVWGRQHTDHPITNSNTFSFKKVPLTVRDAIQVVRNLGRRYLWVDRYCIDQNDASGRDLMIRNMDLIYEKSEITIVALYGDDDQSGLPGVSTVLRKRLPSFKTTNGRLVSSYPPISTMVKNAKWNSRGWTYQEARLSRRCLFFTEYQAYLVCRQSTWSEAVPSDPFSSSLTELLNSSRLDPALFGVNVLAPSGFFRDRLEYTKRDLTLEKDILDAFRGILRRSSFITFWGVPVVPSNGVDIDPNDAFAIGLSWRVQPLKSEAKHVRTSMPAQTKRHQGFPTWSWVSISAKIDQHRTTTSKYRNYIDAIATSLPHNEAEIRFWVYLNGKRVSLQDAISMTHDNALPEHSQKLLVEGDLVTVTYMNEGYPDAYYDVLGKSNGKHDLPQEREMKKRRRGMRASDDDSEPSFRYSSKLPRGHRLNFKDGGSIKLGPERSSAFASYEYSESMICDDNANHPAPPDEDDRIPRYDARRSAQQVQALVLVQWEDWPIPASTRKRRLLLMALKWIDDTHAERLGLITNYGDQFDKDEIDRLPRTRKRFILQ